MTAVSAEPLLLATTADQAVRERATRWVLIALISTTAVLVAPSLVNGYAVATIALLGLGINYRYPLSLRNFFLLYAVGVLYIGNGLVFPDRPYPALDLLLYVGTFLFGYQLFVFPRRNLQPSETRGAVAALPLADPSGATKSHLEKLLWVLAALQALRWFFLLSSYGVTGYYSGQELVDRIVSYSESGSTTPAIVNIGLTALISAAVALYCEQCIQARAKPNYKLLVLVLVALPAFSLQRGMLVYTSVLLAGVYVCVERAKRVDAAPTSTARGRRSRNRLIALAVVGCAVLGAIKIGDIRSRSFNQRVLGASSSQNSLQQVLRAEFTPVIFYRDVKDNIDSLGYRYGTNIVAAFVTRFVPRSIWPNKPITSQEFYAKQLRPAELQQGHVLAPTLFGVGYLNFGLIGCAVLMALLGFVTAYVDQGYVAGLRSRIPLFLIISTWFYSLMRDDLATAAYSVFISIGLYYLFRSHFARDSARSSTAQAPEPAVT